MTQVIVLSLHELLQVLVCPDKKRPDENKDKASFGYNKQVKIEVI